MRGYLNDIVCPHDGKAKKKQGENSQVDCSPLLTLFGSCAVL